MGKWRNLFPAEPQSLMRFRFLLMALFGPEIMPPLWLKGFNLLAQTPRKSLIESLVIKDCVKSQNTKTLETPDSPKHQHTIEFHFANFTQQDRSLLSPWTWFLLICGYTSPPWKIRIRWSFPFEKKTTRRFPAAVNFSLRLCAKKSFLSATTALGLQGECLWVPRGLTVRPLKRWMVGRRAFSFMGLLGSLLRSEQKKTWGVYSDVKDLEKMDEEMLAYEGNRLLL